MLNSFSFTEPLLPWTCHEWLLAELYGFGAAALGPSFFALAALALCLVSAALLLGGTLWRSRHPLAAAAIAGAAIVLFGYRWASARPTGVAMPLAIAMSLLAFGGRFTPRQVAAVVALECLWANLHGSFPLGLLIIAAAILEVPEDRGRRIVAAALAAAVTLINPSGLDLHRLVAAYTLGTEGIHQVIRDNVTEYFPIWQVQSPFWRVIFGIGLMLTLTLAVSAVRERRYRVRALLSFFLLALAIRGVRHVDLAGAVTVVLLFDHLESHFERWFVPSARFARRIAGVAMLLCGATGLVARLAMAPTTVETWVGDYPGGVPFFQLVKQIPDGARVYAPFPAAGLLIWFAAPRGVRVFYDSRNDCYSRSLAEEFFALEKGRLPAEDARAILESRGVQFALLNGDHQLAPLLKTFRNWQVVGRDGAWELWARFIPPAS